MRGGVIVIEPWIATAARQPPIKSGTERRTPCRAPRARLPHDCGGRGEYGGEIRNSNRDRRRSSGRECRGQIVWIYVARRFECRLDFGALFYLDDEVPADDEVTSLTAIGETSRRSGAAFTTTPWGVVL